MKTRILKVNLGKALQAEIKKLRSKSALAAKIGVSPPTLTAMMKDDWQFITREIIERTADYLEMEATEVFEFVPVEFWKQIHETSQCTFLRGAQDDRGNEQDVIIPRSDDGATNEIKDFLRDYVPNFTFADHRRDVGELIDRARSENCIVIGSPKSNAATEILLSSYFKAEPFDPSEANRRKIPFGFCWPNATSIVEQSSLTCSHYASKKMRGQAGIAVKGGVHVPADYKSPEEFLKWETSKGEAGKDCGLVFVANKPFGTDRDVKLIVLAGFSGLGTYAAARALIEDFRYLEPKRGDKHIYGVVQCWYSKRANTDQRSYTNFRWRVRTGGGWPIKIKERPGARVRHQPA